MLRSTILSIAVFLSTVLFYKAEAACSNPTVNVSNITITGFVANWTGAPTTVNFEYILDQSPITPVNPGTPTTNAMQPFTGLIPATTYYLHVRANCGANGFSGWVNTQVITLSLPPCNAPQGLISYGATNFTANIIWAAVPGAVSYQYVLNQSPNTPIIPGIATALTYYNATGLLPATTYYFHLRTDCSAYNGDTSAWELIQFTTQPIPPCQSATGIVANNITNTSADIGWAPQSNILGWEFVVNQSPADPVIGALTTSNAISLSGLNSYTTYFVHLRTDCSTYPDDSSHWVHYSFITSSDSCVEPTGEQVTFVSPYTAFVSWNAAPGAYGYEYLLDQNPGAPTEGGSPTFSTFHTITGLFSATTYYLHVRTVCDTAIYGNNYTNWITAPFYTTPGLNIKNVTGDDKFVIAAYPNPVQQSVTISMKGVQQGSGTLQVIDMAGKVLKTVATAGMANVSIDMTDLAVGMYMLRYSDDGQVYTLRLVKQ